MGLGCYLWAFNAEVTTYPRIALPLFSHGCLVALVLSFGTLWETALGGMPPSPSVISVCREQDCPRQCLLTVRTFSFVLGHFFLLDVGLGLNMRWARVTRFFGPTKVFYILNSYL